MKKITVKVHGPLARLGSALPLFVIGLPFFGLGSFFFVMGIGGFVFPEWRQDTDTWSLLASTIIGGIFALVGGGLMWGAFFGERRGNSGPEGKVLVLGKTPGEWPIFPKDKTWGKGQHFAIRLKPVTTRAAELAVYVIFAVAWNGLSWTVAWVVTFQDKGAPLFAKGIAWLFAGIGIIIILAAIQCALKMLTWRGTAVEIQKELLAPGETTRILIAQAGNFPLEYLRLKIISRESVTYRQGTDTRTETHDIWTGELLELRDIRTQNGRPIAEAEIEIPKEAMHSFASANNKMEWIVRLEMDGPRRFHIAEEYAIRVFPGIAKR